jgi:hypothetical protein
MTCVSKFVLQKHRADLSETSWLLSMNTLQLEKLLNLQIFIVRFIRRGRKVPNLRARQVQKG